MRVNPRRVREDERGAVLMIVALLLFALIGMLVLVFDLGRVVAIRRDQVNAVDAAALAAARECALGMTQAQARAAADTLNTDNSADATISLFDAPQCTGVASNLTSGPKLVTVESTVTVEYFFAQIFGFDSGPVTTRAVAQWGTVSSTNPIPITVNNEQLLNCGIVQDAPPVDAKDCSLSYPKDALQEPRWGVLDLSQWGDPNAAPCSVDANTLADVIESGGWPDTLSGNSYDCLDNGLSFSVWDTMDGRILTFPVIDIALSTGTVKPNKAPLGGQDCTGADILSLQAQGYDCQIDTAYVIGFISLLVNSMVNNGSTVEVQTTYLGRTTGNGIPCPSNQNCADFGLEAVRLVG